MLRSTALAALLALTACSDPAGPQPAITGLFHHGYDDGADFYLYVGNGEVDFYYDLGRCFTRADYYVIERRGERYGISETPQGPVSQDVFLRSVGYDVEMNALDFPGELYLERIPQNAPDVLMCDY